MSRGGSPYDRANVDAAHRCCNNWRKARSLDEVASIRQTALSRYGSWSTPLEFVAKAKACGKADALRINSARFGTLRTTTDW